MSDYTIFIDDVDVRTLGLVFLSDHENPLLSGTRDYEITIPGRNGSLDYGADLEPIPFNLPLYINTTNPLDLQAMVRKVKGILLDANGKPRTFKLRFGYEADKFYNVRVTGSVPIERIFAKSGKFVLPVICHEGYALSLAKNENINWNSKTVTWASAFTWENTGGNVPKSFTSPGTMNVEVVGNNVKPILRVTGSGNNVTIKFNGKTMTLGTFNSSTWVIDLDEYVAIKNGVNGLNSIGGSWLTMQLVEGDNTVTVGGTGLNLKLTFDFRDKWYG